MHSTYIKIVQSFFESRVLVRVGGCIRRHLVLRIQNTEVLLPGLYHRIVVSGYKYSKVLESQKIRYHVLTRYLPESKDLREVEFFSIHGSGKIRCLYSSVGYCLNAMHYDFFSD